MSNPTIAKYGRMYVSVNPNPNLGPATLRLAITDTWVVRMALVHIPSEDTPIDIDITPGAIENVNTSMDFKQLDSRS